MFPSKKDKTKARKAPQELAWQEGEEGGGWRSRKTQSLRVDSEDQVPKFYDANNKVFPLGKGLYLVIS